MAPQTMPAIIHIAVLAGAAFRTEIAGFAEARAALVAVRGYKAVRAGAFGTAGTAGAAHILVPMIVIADPALTAVLIICRHRDRKQRQHGTHHSKHHQY